jgi:hypothetical protein
MSWFDIFIDVSPTNLKPKIILLGSKFGSSSSIDSTSWHSHSRKSSVVLSLRISEKLGGTRRVIGSSSSIVFMS